MYADRSKSLPSAPNARLVSCRAKPSLTSSRSHIRLRAKGHFKSQRGCPLKILFDRIAAIECQLRMVARFLTQYYDEEGSIFSFCNTQDLLYLDSALEDNGNPCLNCKPIHAFDPRSSLFLSNQNSDFRHCLLDTLLLFLLYPFPNAEPLVDPFASPLFSATSYLVSKHLNSPCYNDVSAPAER